MLTWVRPEYFDIMICVLSNLDSRHRGSGTSDNASTVSARIQTCNFLTSYVIFVTPSNLWLPNYTCQRLHELFGIPSKCPVRLYSMLHATCWYAVRKRVHTCATIYLHMQPCACAYAQCTCTCNSGRVHVRWSWHALELYIYIYIYICMERERERRV